VAPQPKDGRFTQHHRCDTVLPGWRASRLSNLGALGLLTTAHRSPRGPLALPRANPPQARSCPSLRRASWPLRWGKWSRQAPAWPIGQASLHAHLSCWMSVRELLLLRPQRSLYSFAPQHYPSRQYRFSGRHKIACCDEHCQQFPPSKPCEIRCGHC